jgi:ribonucleoside-triphosphate reductase
MNPAQEFIFVGKYARWVDAHKRRENYEEAVDRYFGFFEKKFGDKVPKKVFTLCRHQVMTMGAMPSMRAFWTAGPALEQNNICGYNCCSMVIKDLQSFAELFFILMCGTGPGFSVEAQFTDDLPAVKPFTGTSVGTHVVGDNKEGWATSLRVGMEAWFDGKDIEFDYSLVEKGHPRGSRLKTMGGRASGPEPLKRLHAVVRDIVLGAAGRKLRSDENLDICNHIGAVTEVGGIRRAAEISFSDLNDDLMRHAKDAPIPPHRWQSNNSAVYLGRPDMITFLREWTALAASGTGERGIFNLKAAQESCLRRAVDKLGMTWEEFSKYLRTNPCGEILLMALLGEFCNLTEVVIRADDTFADLVEKVKSAVWMGAMQACLTDFPFIRPSFKACCDEEMLLGVSLTGQMDNPKLLTAERLQDLKEVAIRECRKACKALGRNMSAAITTGKPSGTVSQLVNCASGCHPRYAKFYWRRYRLNSVDPLFRMLRDQGLKFTPENGQGPEAVEARRKALITKGRSSEEAAVLVPDWSEDQVMTWVCAFPEAAPAKAITRDQMSAIDQLEWYLKIKKNWCEHNQSVTIYIKPDEWLKVGTWVWEHFDEICGVSFLPYDGGSYEQAPYQEITKEQYERAVKAFPKIDYSQLYLYEEDDNTTGAKQVACGAGGCESR